MRKQRKSVKDTIVCLLEKRDYSPADLRQELGVSSQIIHRCLKALHSDGHVEKIGKPPKTYYRLVKKPPVTIKSSLIEKNFVFKDAVGDIYTGVEAFLLWSKDNLKKYSLDEKVVLYEKAVQKMKDFRKESPLLSLNEKLDDFHKKTDEPVHLKELVCAIPYSLPDFGKTKESIFLSIAKEGSTQSREFADALVKDFLPYLLTYIERQGFDAVAFIPPSASRRVQLMNILKKRFSDVSDLPVVRVQKRHGRVIQQQKHLKSVSDRLRNADYTFYIPLTDSSYEKVLLIDDFVGSGATLNQVAKKLVRQDVSREVFGIGMVGAQKGFEVVKKV